MTIMQLIRTFVTEQYNCEIFGTVFRENVCYLITDKGEFTLNNIVFAMVALDIDITKYIDN